MQRSRYNGTTVENLGETIPVYEVAPPRKQSVTGYGAKLGTPYAIIDDKRRKRLWAICYSNVSTFYFLRKGNRIIINLF